MLVNLLRSRLRTLHPPTPMMSQNLTLVSQADSVWFNSVFLHSFCLSSYLRNQALHLAGWACPSDIPTKCRLYNELCKVVQIMIHELPWRTETPAFQPVLVHQPDWPLMAVLLEMLNPNCESYQQFWRAVGNAIIMIIMIIMPALKHNRLKQFFPDRSDGSAFRL